MKKGFTRILAMIMAFTLILSFAACGGKGETATTAAVKTTDAADDAVATTDENVTEGITADVTGANTTDGKTSEPVTTPVTTTVPKGNAAILAAYTEVMNYAKTAKPAYTKVEYQVLPKDKRNIDSGIVNTLLGLASSFMTTEEDAKNDPEVNEKGSNMRWFPVYKCDKGCLLTDVSAVKSANCEKLSNGNFKITMVLNSEDNPEPYNENTKKCTSNVGKVFGPLAKAEIDAEIKGIKVIRTAEYALNYYDCKAVLVYNPATKQIVTLDQYMYTLINIIKGKVLLTEFSGTAVLEDTVNIYNVKY